MTNRESGLCDAHGGVRPADADTDIAMSDEHWRILWFMRDFRIRNRIPASVDDIVRFLAEDLAYGERARSRLFELFPHTHAFHICLA